MTDHNPYDFLSGDAPANGASPQHSDTAPSPYEENAPEATIPRSDSVAALAAQDYVPGSETTGEANGQNAVELATVPELAPLADLPADSAFESQDFESQDFESRAVELQSAPDAENSPSVADALTSSYDSERAILQAQEPDINAPKDVELGLMEHLGELRMRILRTVCYILVASAVTWNQTPRIQEFLLKPVLGTLDKYKIGIGLTTTEPMQAFTTYFQMALVSALIVSAPLMLWEMWRFIEPALTGVEKRFSRLLLPFSIMLFVTGCALGYAVSPMFFNFFLQFVPPGVQVLWTYGSVVVLLGKMLLVFGVCFQVPVVTIFLNKTGIVSRNWLIEYWRHVVIAIFVIVSILTPTWDPVTLLVCAVPPCLLYALSIWLVKWL